MLIILLINCFRALALEFIGIYLSGLYLVCSCLTCFTALISVQCKVTQSLCFNSDSKPHLEVSGVKEGCVC